MSDNKFNIYKYLLIGLLLPVYLFSNAAAQQFIEPDAIEDLFPMPSVFNMDDDLPWGEEPVFLPFEGAALERIENPNKSVLNETDYVLQYEKTEGSQPWAGFFFHLEEPYQITDSSEFRLKIRSPRSDIQALLKLEVQEPGFETPDLFADITAADEWIELVWDLSDQSDQAWDRVLIILDMDFENHPEGGADFTWFLDDFRLKQGEASDDNGDGNGNGDGTGEFTVYYSNPEDWSQVLVYAWEMYDGVAVQEMSLWPGDPAEKEHFDDGSEWWSFTLPDIFNWVIFNDGAGNQTDDLNRNTTGWFDGEEWHDQRPGAPDDPDDPDPYISIAEARELPNGSEVTIRGIITRAQGDFSRIQDETAAMVIRQVEDEWHSMVASGDLAEGDMVQLTGVTSEFASLKQINEGDLIDFDILSRGNPLPEAQLLTLAQIQADGYQLQSQLIRVENLTLHTDDPHFRENANYMISDETSYYGSVELRISWSRDQPIVGTPIEDSIYIFEGVLGQFSHGDPDQGFQLMPIYPEDMMPAAADTVAPDQHEVTFMVDMSRADGFDPVIHDVYISGEMFDWAVPGTNPDARLERINDESYTITLLLEEGTYDYKYFLVEDEPTWDMGEWTLITPDRQIGVTGSMVVSDVFGHLTEPVEEENFSLIVKDVNGVEITLTMGLDPEATGEYRDGIDQYAAPLWPGVFDARILYEDDDFVTLILPPTVDQTVWNISLQPPPEGLPIELMWDPGMVFSEGMTTLRDQHGNVLVDMTGSGRYLIEQQEHFQLQVVHTLVTYKEVSWNRHWNMVGLPLHTADAHYKELFPGSFTNTLYTFDGAYALREYLESGTGYWLRFPEAGSATLSGMPIEQIELDLETGWNMISGPSHTVEAAMIEDQDGILLTGTLYGFDGAYVQASEIQPGAGYWIRTSGPGTITLGDADHQPGKQVVPGDDPDLSDFDRLIVNNIEGHSRTLYFGATRDESIPELLFTLPPLPPEGAFDARFSDDRMLVSGNSGVIDIASASDISLTLKLSGSSDDRSYQFTLLDDNAEGKTIELWHGQSQTLNLSGKPIKMLMSLPTGITEEVLPREYELGANYPNPFNPSTTITYSLPEQSSVHIAVYNLLGQKVALLVNEERPAGRHQVIFDGSGTSSGVYIYRMQAGDYRKARQMMLVK